MKFGLTSSTTRIQGPVTLRDIKIPVDAVGPVMKAIAAKHGITTSELAVRSGVCQRRMHYAVTRIGKPTAKLHLPATIAYEFVDTVLTRSGEQHLWHEQPLRDLFLAGLEHTA